MTRVTCDPYRDREVQGHSIRWSTMSRITDMRNDLQSESAGWLFKSLLAGAGAYCVSPLQAAQLVYYYFLAHQHKAAGVKIKQNVKQRLLLLLLLLLLFLFFFIFFYPRQVYSRGSLKIKINDVLGMTISPCSQRPANCYAVKLR